MYDVNRLNNPVVIELKNTVSFVVISATNFALVSDRCVVTYSYDNDRSIGSLILKNTQSGGISRHSISLSNNTIAIVDQVDRRVRQILVFRSGLWRILLARLILLLKTFLYLVI